MSKAKLALVLAIATVLAVSVVAAVVTAEKQKEQSKPKVTLELIWQKDFEEPVAAYLAEPNNSDFPVLRAVAFVHDHGVGPSATYGKGVSVSFLDSGGKTATRVVRESDYFGSQVMTSKDGRYLGISRVVERSQEFISKVDFELYDAVGNPVWARENLEARPARVLPNAKVLSYEGMFWRKFTLHGDNQITVQLSPTQAEGTGAIDISENSYIAFNVHDMARRVGNVVLYDGDGNEMWRKDFESAHTGEVVISDEGQYIAAIAKSASGRTLTVYSNKGDLLWQYPSGDCQLMDFSPDSRYLAAGTNLNEISLFRSNSGNLIWNFKLEGPRAFYALAVSKDADLVAAAQAVAGREGPAGESSTVLLLDKQGHTVWRREFEVQAQRGPRVLFTDEGTHLLVAAGRRIICYRIVGGAK